MNPTSISTDINDDTFTIVNITIFSVSLAIVIFAIVLLVYAFKVDGTDCSKRKIFKHGEKTGDTKPCLLAFERDNNGKITSCVKDIQKLRVMAMIVGFLVLIPLALQIVILIKKST